LDEFSIREAFPLRLKYYMDKSGKRRNDLVRDLGYKYTTVRDWEKGITVPRMDKVEQLAAYFNCSTSDLLEIKKEPAMSDGLSGPKLELLELLSDLSETEAAVLLASLKSALGK